MFTVLSLVASTFASPAASPLQPALRPPVVRLSNMANGAAADTEVFPPMNQDVVVVASRVTAGAAMDVVRYGYRLVGASEECDAGMPHVATLWKETDGVRQATRAFYIQGAPDAPQRVISLPIAESIHLERGESLVMTVELMREGEVSMCMVASSQGPTAPNAQYISMDEEIHHWVSFSSLGIDASMDMAATAILSPRR
jgi:hypothetical protein